MKNGIIIGAGIGGLTTAIALARKGIKTTIFEQAAVLADIGAGIWVAPNGLKVYETLGLDREIIQAGHSLYRIQVVDTGLNPISEVDCVGLMERHRFRTVSIHRAALQKILLAQVDPASIRLGMRCEGYAQSGTKATVLFENGTSHEADFVIFADGIHSRGRVQMTGNANLRYSGQTCWRFVTKFGIPDPERGNMYEIWGSGKGLRVGYSLVNHDEVYVFITHWEKAGLTDKPATRTDDLLRLCSGFPEIVRQLIASADPSAIIRTDLYDFAPIPNWIDKNVALLGDAAHATTPNLGLGACQAIEDAQAIAEALAATDDTAQALTHYQRRRMEKAHFITNTSWRFAQVSNTQGWVKSAIAAVLRLTPDSINQKQLDKIYSVESTKFL